nr:DUF6701 domain-containing protein [Natronospira proteinivora]
MDEAVVLTANGALEELTVAAGETVVFEAQANNCPDSGQWRDSWDYGDGSMDTQQLASSSCERSPIEQSRVYDSPGTYEASFTSEYCTFWLFFFCAGSWAEHGSDTVTIIVEDEAIDAETVIDYRMEAESWNGASGEVEDSSGYDNDGTAFDGADTDDESPVRSGDPGTCRYASIPSDGRISTSAPSELQQPDEFSVAFWFRAQDVSPQDSILSIGELNGTYARPVEILRNADGILRVVITDEGNNEQTLGHDASAFSGEWVHIAVTRRLGDAPGANQQVVEQLYVNGELVDFNDDERPNPPSLMMADDIHIGGLPGAYSGAADYDDVVFAEGALAQDGIEFLRDRDLPCPTAQLDHIRLTHPQSGLTCSPSEVSVQACADAACNEFFEEVVDLAFTSPGGNWSDNPISFTDTASVLLQYTQAETITVFAEATEPEAANPTRCFSAGVETNCEMDIASAGFVLDVPDHVSDEVVGGTVTAVREDDESPQCVPGFSDESKSVGFSQSYSNPDSGFLSVLLNGTALGDDNDYTPLSLDFDAEGVAEVDLQYPDVGEVQLNARYEGDDLEEGLVMLGQGSFIARPDHFTVVARSENMSIPEDSGASGPDGPIFATAGDEFEIEVSARNLSGDVTPNFGQESPAETVELEVDLAEPSGGNNPPLSGDLNPFGSDCDGDEAPGLACGEFSWAEVGILAITPRLAGGQYLTMPDSDVVGQSTDNIGRFVPAYYSVSRSGPELAAACTQDEPYNYLTRPMSFNDNAELTVTARNSDGLLTENAEGVWWRFEDRSGETSRSGGDFRYRDCQIENDDDFTDCDGLADTIPALAVDPGAVSIAENTGDSVSGGTARLVFGDGGGNGLFGHRWTSANGAPDIPPFQADFRTRVRIVDEDDIPFRRFENDSVVEETWYELTLPVEEDAEQRHGRLAIGNAHGSELLDLQARVVVESFQEDTSGQAWWRVNSDDACSDEVELTVEAQTASTPATLIESGDGCGFPEGFDKVWRETAQDGDFNAWFQCSNEVGSHRVNAETLPEWLRYDWSGDDDAHDQAPDGIITFGIHRGPDRRIDFREAR